MYFCGIDTGSRIVGYALLNNNGDIVNSGQVDLELGVPDDFSAKEAFMWRLKKLYAWMLGYFNDLIDLYGLDIVVGIESPWIGNNYQSALKLGKAWGIIAGAAMDCGFEVLDISPAEAKVALTASSKASKDIVMYFAKMLTEISGQDQADAIAVALATRKKVIEREWLNHS